MQNKLAPSFSFWYNVRMNLYLISQNQNTGWDTYDSAVVAAESIEAARLIHPRELLDYTNVGAWKTDAWSFSPESVKVEYIGRAGPLVKKGVICASFNAG